jgi:putative acetyltransferase
MEARGEIIIIRAADSHLDAVAYLWHQSALGMDGRPDVSSPEVLRSRIQVELQSGWELHVALRRQRLVGMLALKPSETILDQIFVLPGEQGKGVGAALMGFAKRVMPSGFTLRMAASNESARRFYEKEGMSWLRDGFHPWTGVPVRFYGWNVR